MLKVGLRRMKVFISWSGELSKKIAESLKKWLPCIIQTVDVFFSPDDIEKGENWDSKISKELSECKYGIICLTTENVTAPWINFEAGAIAKTLDSRVASIMINVSPSDIKGPLSRYQATKIDKDDFYQLISNINNQCESNVNSDTLKTVFENLWGAINSEFEEIISNAKKNSSAIKKSINNTEAIEEILLLLRKQNALLTSPQQLLPEDYFNYISDTVFRRKNLEREEEFFEEVFNYIDWLLSSAESNEDLRNVIPQLKIDDLINVIGKFINRKTSRHIFMHFRDVRNRYWSIFESFERMPPHKQNIED